MDQDKSKDELLRELTEAQQRIKSLEAELEQLKSGPAISKLTPSQTLLQLIFNEIDACIWLTEVRENGEFVWIYNNPADQRATGYNLCQPQGVHFESVMPAEQAELNRRYCREVIERGRPVSFEDTFTVEDQAHWIWNTLIPVHDDLGRINLIIGTGIDITERKQAERALRQSHNRYFKLAAHLPGLIYQFMLQPDGTMSLPYISPASYRLFGVTPEKLQSDFQELFAKIFEPDFDSMMTSILRSAQHLQLWHWVGRARINGEIRWIEGRSQPEKQADGSIIWDGLLLDITEQKRAEIALQKSEERYRIISEVLFSVAYVYRVEPDGRFVREWGADQAVQRITGFSYAEIDGLGGWLTLVHPEDVPQARQYLENLMTGKTSSIEYRIITRQGETRWLREYTRPIWDETQGRITYIYGAGQDISEYKQLEEQLRQSQKMEALGQLAGGVAHHFNNMFTAIIGYLHLALELLPANHPAAADLQKVLKTSQQAAILTKQLLTFTRRQFIQPQTADLNSLILDTKEMLSQLIDEKIVLKTELRPGLKPVQIDAGQFEQLLVNLVVNACDAMPSGGVLTLKTAPVQVQPAEAPLHGEVPAGDYILLTVTDTGIGMTEQVKARLFEPFFTTKGVGQGTGLGLSTCFGIVKQNNGHIACESQVGRGTTFKVYLPALSLEVAAPTTGSSAGTTLGGQETILLVEDEAAVRELSARILRQRGYKVLEASNGRDALRLLARHPDLHLNLVLTDVVMPHLNGDDLVRQLRRKDPQIKALFISGYATNLGDDQESEAFLAKPFTPNLLLEKVRATLNTP